MRYFQPHNFIDAPDFFTAYTKMIEYFNSLTPVANRKLALGRWLGFLKFWRLYATDKQKHLAWEVEAYRVSYRKNPAGLSNYALYLRQYGINMTQAEALRLLTE
jgi:hypothetical protein